MRTTATIAILLAVLFAGNLFAEFPRQKPEKHMFHCPANSENVIKPFSRTAYETREREYTINNIVSETSSDDIESIQTGTNIINISSDITSNTIWTSNNTYHILNPIEVNGAMLVIEPGTTVTFAGGGSDAGIKVLNGGTLIARGTPGNPILFTSDSSTPDYDDYYCPAFIEETASETTQITYCIFEWAYAGIILIDRDLDTDIENNYFMACVWGIIEYGPKHTDIINNLCFGSEYCGIYLSMASPYGAADANSHILIQNNTCDYYQERGITVYGVDDCNYAGFVELKNNIVSEASDYGISLWDCLYVTATNTGYYNNYADKNFDFPEYDPVEAVSNPYIEGPGGLDYCYLNQSCPFIDAGYEYIEETRLIGMTTAVDGVPDGNKIDIGFHYPNWDYSNAGTTTLQADFDNSLRVDYNDLAMFADYWLFDYNEAEQAWLRDFDDSGKVDYGDLMVISKYWLEPFDFIDFADFASEWQKEVDDRLYDGRFDLYYDGIVNFRDFAGLANEWQMTAEGNPAIVVSVMGDVNNLKGEVGVSVGGCPYSTSTAFIIMDGQLIDETDYRADEGEPGITINTPSYLNGSHLLKAVVIDHNRRITVSENLVADFNNPVHCLNLEDTYEPNKPLRLLGLSATGNNLQIKLSKWNGDLVWSQQTSGNLDINIPGSALAGQIYDVSIEQESGEMQLMDSGESWEQTWKKVINKKYNLNDGSYIFAIFIPDAWGCDPPLYIPQNSANARKRTVAAIVNGCETMGIPYIVLYGDNCTWDNFAQVLSLPNVFNVYIVSRGASSLPGAYVDQRTFFKLSGGHNVVSYIDSSEPLGGGWDNNPKVHSMASLGFGDTAKFKLVWIDVCLNGLFDDMAKAWMKFDIPTLKSLYVSWESLIGLDNDSDFCLWSTFFWGHSEGFGLYGANTFFYALGRVHLYVHGADVINGKVTPYGDTGVRFTGHRIDP